LPNAKKAIVERGKIADYLLDAAHPDNGGKAAFFESLGFHRVEPEVLATALQNLAREAEVAQASVSPHGRSLQPACWRRISELVIARSLLLEIFLSNHVQLRVGRQLCVARRLLSGFLPDFISRPFLRCSTVSSAMSKEHRHAAHDDPR